MPERRRIEYGRVRCQSIFIVAAALVLLSGSATAQPGAAPELPRFPVRFHVASEDGAAVADAAWIQAQIDRANEILGRYGLTFTEEQAGPMGAERAHIESRRDRHALAGLAAPRVINCFVVASLRDVDQPESYIRGVHWHSRTHPGRHYIILSKIAAPGVLAHELGHFFGNRQHSDVPGNLMSYLRGDSLPFLDEAQVRTARRFARRFLQTGELIPADRLVPGP